jgi:hypothetical protein
MDDVALTRRAFAAYFRTDGEFADIPGSTSGVTFYKDRAYVVLRNGITHTLAVYRVRNDGVLRRMRRWPAAVEQW